MVRSSDAAFLASLAPVSNLAGARQSSADDQEWNQPDGLKPSQKYLAGTPADPLAGGGVASVPPPVAGSIAQGADFSPSSEGRSGRGGGQVAPAGATKTIQSYFYKPSSGTAVQNLAASYGAGEFAGQARAASGLPNEVDLSGADGDSNRGEPSLAQPMAKIGRSSSTGSVGGGGAGDGRSLQHRFSNAAASAGDQGVGQAQHGHRHAQNRALGSGLAGGGVGSASGQQAGSEQETLERLHESLKEAKALEAQLRKELARANLERGSMETMVGRAADLAGKPACGCCSSRLSSCGTRHVVAYCCTYVRMHVLVAVVSRLPRRRRLFEISLTAQWKSSRQRRQNEMGRRSSSRRLLKTCCERYITRWLLLCHYEA